MKLPGDSPAVQGDVAEAAIGQRRHDLIGHRLVQQARLIGAIHFDPRQIVVATHPRAETQR
ncbi:MAG: hypothetical protein R3F36_12745 [Candidatus Competibacteraceae bacterium]